jgi:dihydropyrimidinase
VRGHDLTLDVLDKKAEATGSYADYGFHVIITNPTSKVVHKEIPDLMKQGISSCKLFVRQPN